MDLDLEFPFSLLLIFVKASSGKLSHRPPSTRVEEQNSRYVRVIKEKSERNGGESETEKRWK